MKVRKFSVLSLIAAALLMCASAAPVAAQTAPEITPDDNGMWYDPAKSGEGFYIFQNGSGFTVVTAFLGTYGHVIPLPIWFTAQGHLSPAGELPMFSVVETPMGLPHDLSAVQVGSLTLIHTPDGGISAKVVINEWPRPVFSPSPFPITVHYNLHRLTTE